MFTASTASTSLFLSWLCLPRCVARCERVSFGRCRSLRLLERSSPLMPSPSSSSGDMGPSSVDELGLDFLYTVSDRAARGCDSTLALGSEPERERGTAGADVMTTSTKRGEARATMRGELGSPVKRRGLDERSLWLIGTGSPPSVSRGLGRPSSGKSLTAMRAVAERSVGVLSQLGPVRKAEGERRDAMRSEQLCSHGVLQLFVDDFIHGPRRPLLFPTKLKLGLGSEYTDEIELPRTANR